MVLLIQLLLGLATVIAAIGVAASRKEAQPSLLDAQRTLGAPLRTLSGESADPFRNT